MRTALKGRIAFGIFGICLASIVLLAAATAEDASVSSPDRLRIATTTSLYDTKLLDVLETLFEDEYNVSLDIISGGTGIAIENGERGNVDVLMVHDKVRELKFIAEGHGLERRCFAYNYFWMVGPKSDPANISGLTASEALKAIMTKGLLDPEKVRFISRGDNSGTHAREKLLWTNAGVDYSQMINDTNPWYKEAGAGMAATLVMADEMEAYTLTDMSTFTAYQGNLSLVPLIKGSEDLLNVYVAIPINPAKHPGVNCEMAQKFVDFLVSPKVQDIISTYGEDRFGVPLFFKAAGNCEVINCSAEECAIQCSVPCAT